MKESYGALCKFLMGKVNDDKVTSRSQERRKGRAEAGGLAKTQGRHGSGLDQYDGKGSGRSEILHIF